MHVIDVVLLRLPQAHAQIDMRRVSTHDLPDGLLCFLREFSVCIPVSGHGYLLIFVGDTLLLFVPVDQQFYLVQLILGQEIGHLLE
jgi:hypothetical protein